MKVTVYRHAAQLPAIPEGSYFHSPELMELCEHTPRHQPYMAVVTADDGRVLAHMLAIMRYQRSWLPPYIYPHVRVMGEGEYHDDSINVQRTFELMAETITTRLQNKTLFLEFSHLSEKMFGYKALRKLGYFHVRWMNIHNSLHSHTPEERISNRQMRRIENAIKRGATTKHVETPSVREASEPKGWLR